MAEHNVRSKTVAVVGAGIAGLASALLLHKHGYKVTLYESQPVCGGHALTDHTAGVPVDLGFQVYNLTTYPHLVGMFDYLGLESEPSDMSFALSNAGGLEWGSRGLRALLAQPLNLLSPSFWRMLIDVFRWGWGAPEVLTRPRFATMTLGEYIRLRGYSRPFVSGYLLPMCAAIWSAPDADVLAYPVRFMVSFWQNHHLLNIFRPRPVWRVLRHRSSDYVAKIMSILGEANVRAGRGVVSVRRAHGGPGGILVEERGPEAAKGDAHATANGVNGVPAGQPAAPKSGNQAAAAAGKAGLALAPGGAAAAPGGSGRGQLTCSYDAVVMATHTDVTLRLLGPSATPEERRLLGAFRYQANDVVLHTDPGLMPRARAAWASWNCLQAPARSGQTKAAAGKLDAAAGGGGDGASSSSSSACAPSPPAAAASSVSVTYWLNLLQNLPPSTPPLFVTLNPPRPPAPGTLLRALEMSHPVLSLEAVAAQAALPTIQGAAGVYFAGAWAGNGFHEDGLLSAVRVAEAMGAAVPWVPRAVQPVVPWSTRLFLRVLARFGQHAFQRGSLRMVLPTGEEIVFGTRGKLSDPEAGPQAVMWIRDCRCIGRFLQRHDIGVGEGYMYGEYECSDLVALMTVLAANARHIQANRGQLGLLNWAGDKLAYLAHLGRANTIAGSRRNIEEHYDAGNALYALFLDETMTYSCGLHYTGPPGTASGVPRPLEEAQYAKLDEIIRRADIRAEHAVLEVGCGWGAFALRAVRTTGCRLVGVTVSKEQLELARARVREAGLEARIEILYCDYRLLPHPGSYDRVVSVEMLEAVGHENLPAYFQALGRALKPGGRACVQVITMPDERYDEYRRSSDFIRAHIFPGGHLPSLGAMLAACKGTGLSLAGKRDIGLDYAVTLRHWREKLYAERARVLALGYSEVFWRKYLFYFAYCEAAFQTKYITNWMLDLVAAGGEGGAGAEAAPAARGALGGGADANGNGNGAAHANGNGNGHSEAKKAR